MLKVTKIFVLEEVLEGEKKDFNLEFWLHNNVWDFVGAVAAIHFSIVLITFSIVIFVCRNRIRLAFKGTGMTLFFSRKVTLQSQMSVHSFVS